MNRVPCVERGERESQFWGLLGQFVLAWPSAESGTLPVESRVAVMFGKQLESVRQSKGVDAADEMQRELEQKYSKGLNPFGRADSMGVHDLIDPRETRPKLCDWIELLAQPLLPRLLGKTRFHYMP